MDGECVGASISNLGILASVDNDSEFLYAVSNFAMVDRGSGDLTFVLNLQNWGIIIWA